MTPKSAVTASNMATILRPSVHDLTVQLATQSKEFREDLNFESLMMILCNRLRHPGAIQAGENLAEAVGRQTKVPQRRYSPPITPVLAGRFALDRKPIRSDNLSCGTRRERAQRSEPMRNALAFMTAVALTVAALAAPAQAHEWWPVIPAEVGVPPRIVGVGWAPYRCAYGPVYNFYHDAYYGGEPPALYLGYAYRPYYQYAAYRVAPRTYLCDARR
jgi:hypothetical protein